MEKKNTVLAGARLRSDKILDDLFIRMMAVNEYEINGCFKFAAADGPDILRLRANDSHQVQFVRLRNAVSEFNAIT